MNPKLKKTIAVLRFSTIMYISLGIFWFIALLFSYTIPAEERLFYILFFLFGSITSLAMGIFFEIVIKNLKEKKYWSWIAALVLCGMYLTSLLFPLGIIGIIGLVDKEVKEDFFAKK